MTWLESQHTESKGSWQTREHEIGEALALAALSVGALVVFKDEALGGLARAGEKLETTALPQLVVDAEHAAGAGEAAASEILSGTAGLAGPKMELAQEAGLEAKALPGRVGQAKNLTEGANFRILNPKTGSSIETRIKGPQLEDGIQGALLFTNDGRYVADLAYCGSAPGYMSEFDSLYGTPRAQKPFLWLNRMNVDPEFRGQGVRDALVDELRNHSRELGFGGRIKLFAYTNEGTVSAIPWYKSGFRPVDGSFVNGQRLTAVSDLLKAVVDSKAHVPIELGKAFDSLMMELPES